jgi:murein DD-endopeptidase MepM/ murein hydrolase activator NlpD
MTSINPLKQNNLTNKAKYSLIYLSFIAFSSLAPAPAEAFIFEFLFGKSSSTVSKTVSASKSDTTIQNLDVLGDEGLNGKKDTKAIFSKIFNSEISALSVEQGSMRNSVEVAATEENLHTMDELAVYTVKKDDSLASIASYFQVSIDTISTFNKLDNNKVSAGDVLEIPQISGILYTIKAGDTLEKIAKEYKVDSENISLYNAIIPTVELVVNEDIFLPGAKLTKQDDKKDSSKLAKAKKDKEIAAKKAKEAKDNLAKSKTGKANQSDVSAIAKVKRFGGKFANLPISEGYYGRPAASFTVTQKLHGANGADLAAPIGTDILASAAGTVSVARSSGWNYGYGQYIVITHDNGSQTLYAHLSSVDVVPGQVVGRGEKIGDMGSTGNSTGSHVHFEVRGAYNPYAW